MKNLRGKVVVITGAASVIGRALALKFAKKGASLALCDVNGRDLERISWDVQVLGAKVFYQIVDVGVVEQLELFRDNILKTFESIDVVINNAGVSLSEPVMQSKSENTQWILNSNLFGVINGSRVFLRDLLRQKEARIVNVSSVFGIVGIPNQSIYCASKFAVRGFTESLRAELLGSTVKVILVLPGGVKTDIVPYYARLYDDRSQKKEKDALGKNFFNIAPTSSEDVANQIVRAVQKPTFRVVVGSDAKLIDMLARMLPALVNRIVAFISTLGTQSPTGVSLQQQDAGSNNKKAV